jgi:hypothetical protein
MRIGGYGTGGFRQDGGRDRAASFRARHSIGQRIKGRILRKEPNGLYWILAGGEELLARLEVQAEPGNELLFVVRALTPEIMLQALPEGMSAADLPGLVQRFRAAREVFEIQDSQLLSGLVGLPPVPAARVEAFRAALAQNDAASKRLADVLRLLGQVNALLPPDASRTAAYEPWLLPQARRQEAIRTASGGLRLSAVDAAAGEMELTASPTEAGIKLLFSAERPDAATAMLAEVATLLCGEPVLSANVTGPTRLRPNPLGGVLAELFGTCPSWSSGGLNTRV